ncbi:oligo-alpha-mannoside phosphotransferase system enzyme IIC [Bacillus spizizenii]|nr:oligo-alpha-mannoside phosphotransferase system enzyme IIC [Bacillus spizizenii]
MEYTAGRKPFCLYSGKRNPSYYFKTVYGDLYSRDGRNGDDACDCVDHSHIHEKQADEASIETRPRPGIFNVNEPIIFGLPIVMNPIIIVPWVLAPMVVTLVTYLAMSAGLVPPPTGVTVPWTVPLFINGIMATNSIMGA